MLKQDNAGVAILRFIDMKKRSPIVNVIRSFAVILLFDPERLLKKKT